MAQILKKDVKDRIIISAKKEFIENGIKDSSMRDIAKGADITVGNLYRYFKNKDDIIDTIVNPALFELNKIVRSLTGDQIDIGSSVEQIDMSADEALIILDKLSFELAKLNSIYRDEMIILIRYSDKTEFLKQWFYDLVVLIIDEIDTEKILSVSFIGVFAKALCSSIFAGFSDILISDSLSVREKELLIKTFFRYFMGSIDAEIGLMKGS